MVSCKGCGHAVTCKHDSITSMRKHLAAHSRYKSSVLGQHRPNGFRGTVLSSHKNNWIVSALTAVLNIPNAQLGHPVFCTLFKDSKLGTINAVIASKTVDKEYYRVRDLITKELNRMKRQEAIFTLTIDEWSFRRKRFIGVFLCSSQTIKFMDTKFLELLYRFREQATAPNLLEGIRASIR